MSQPKYQKREICLLDIPSRVQKKDVDLALKGHKFQLVNSRTEKNINVEFKSVQIAWEVRKFVLAKKLYIYKGKPFKFVIKGNRILICKGMEGASFDEIRAFFNNYGEVNGIYLTQQYFAILATITQAIELVEKVGSITIDGGIYQFKYAFDNNPGKSAGSTGNFEVEDRESYGINADDSIPISTNSGGLGASGLSDSKISLSSGNSANGLGNSTNGGQPNAGQKKKTKKKPYPTFYQPHVSTIALGANHPKSNPNPPKPASPLLATPVDNVKVNSLKLNTNTPLFARGPEASSSVFSSLEKLNYNGPDFKSISYLENKNKPQQQQQQSHQPLTITTSNAQANQPTNPSSMPVPRSDPLVNRSSSSDRYHYVSPALANALNSPTKSTGNLPPFAKPTNASITTTGGYYKTAPYASNNHYSAPSTSTMPLNNKQPTTIPKQPATSSASPAKVNYFASPSNASKPNKKEDGCVIM